MIKRFKDLRTASVNPKVARNNTIKRLVTATKTMESSLKTTDDAINRIYTAFANSKRSFQRKQVEAAIVSLHKISRLLDKYTASAYKSLKEAISSDLPNTRIANLIDDLQACKAKALQLRAQAASSIGADVVPDGDDEVIPVDETGYVVGEDVVDNLEQQPVISAEELGLEDDEIPAQATKAADENQDVNFTEPAADAGLPPQASKAAGDDSGSDSIISPDQEAAIAAEMETAAENGGVSASELEEPEAQAADDGAVPGADELELTDQGIDDVVSAEILSDDEENGGMPPQIETDEMSSKTALKQTKLATATRTSGAASEDDILASYMDDILRV